ncbi:MAG TPA: alpha/beta hydrolase [Blastocatellia bacterium]|nr:alpha/beta hydrolase [Blastocatellia bacterium]
MTNKDHGQGTNHLRARRAARALGLAMLAATLLPAVELSLAQSNAQTIRNIEYARAGGHTLLLDLYLPAESTTALPLIVWVHGGGWASGDKGNGGHAARLTERGYAVASINYRLSWEDRFPAQIEDCKAAIRWLRANASRYNLDPDRIGVWGSSAGGHLAALLGTSGGVEELEGDLGNQDQSSRVQAVIDWYGPADLLRMQSESLPCGVIDHDSPLSPEALLLGCPIQLCKDRARRASPVTYATSDDPPFLIMHGTEDCLVPPLQSRDMQEALAAVGVEATLKFIQGAGHGGDEFETAENRKLVDDFLDRHLARPAQPRITRAEVRGKKLLVFGESFARGAVILVDGRREKTKGDDKNLISKKAGKNIASGQTVTLRVENPGGVLSEEFLFIRP